MTPEEEAELAELEKQEQLRLGVLANNEPSMWSWQTAGDVLKAVPAGARALGAAAEDLITMPIRGGAHLIGKIGGDQQSFNYFPQSQRIEKLNTQMFGEPQTETLGQKIAVNLGRGAATLPLGGVVPQLVGNVAGTLLEEGSEALGAGETTQGVLGVMGNILGGGLAQAPGQTAKKIGAIGRTALMGGGAVKTPELEKALSMGVKSGDAIGISEGSTVNALALKRANLELARINSTDAAEADKFLVHSIKQQLGFQKEITDSAAKVAISTGMDESIPILVKRGYLTQDMPDTVIGVKNYLKAAGDKKYQDLEATLAKAEGAARVTPAAVIQAADPVTGRNILATMQAHIDEMRMSLPTATTMADEAKQIIVDNLNWLQSAVSDTRVWFGGQSPLQAFQQIKALNLHRRLLNEFSDANIAIGAKQAREAARLKGIDLLSIEAEAAYQNALTQALDDVASKVIPGVKPGDVVNTLEEYGAVQKFVRGLDANIESNAALLNADKIPSTPPKFALPSFGMGNKGISAIASPSSQLQLVDYLRMQMSGQNPAVVEYIEAALRGRSAPVENIKTLLSLRGVPEFRSASRLGLLPYQIKDLYNDPGALAAVNNLFAQIGLVSPGDSITNMPEQYQNEAYGALKTTPGLENLFEKPGGYTSVGANNWMSNALESSNQLKTNLDHANFNKLSSIDESKLIFPSMHGYYTPKNSTATSTTNGSLVKDIELSDFLSSFGNEEDASVMPTEADDMVSTMNEARAYRLSQGSVF